MRYASVCSGIEAASAAWQPLDWEAAWLSEIEPFPCAVLAHHYPDVPNLGDMTRITEADIERHGRINLLVGGTPCQSFSVAGLRKGMADPRGNLALEFLRLADAARPDWLVWENVPGVLSSNDGRDFGSFLGALVKLGYGFAYRVLDAQYFGLAQRRKRVFVVGHLGDWRRASAVLFERQSMSGDSPPSRDTGAGVAAHTSTGVGTCGADDNQAQAGHLIPSTGDVAHCLNAGGMGRLDYESETLVAYSITNGTFAEPRFCIVQAAVARTLDTTGVQQPERLQGGNIVLHAARCVRRLTPRECERLQGFPDDYTLVTYRNKPAADGPRYKALGNSMAVPVMRWIGERIEQVEALTEAA